MCFIQSRPLLSTQIRPDLQFSAPRATLSQALTLLFLRREVAMALCFAPASHRFSALLASSPCPGLHYGQPQRNAALRTDRARLHALLQLPQSAYDCLSLSLEITQQRNDGCQLLR